MKHTDYLAKIEDDPEYQQGLADLKTHFALGDAILRARIRKDLLSQECPPTHRTSCF